MKEIALYPPVKSYLEKQGFTVKGEVKDCDVVAIKGDITVIVELKVSINLSLLLQAVDRKTLTENVYIAVPNSGTLLKKQYRLVINLLKLLGLGLLLIEPNKMVVDPVLDPSEYKPRKKTKNKERLLKEFSELVGDPNIGGSQTVSGRMTAYRQKALAVAEYLTNNGPTKASTIKDSLNESKCRDILYRNVYGWFEMKGKGVYGITPKGKNEYAYWEKKRVLIE